jgi:hypothetical protein
MFAQRPIHCTHPNPEQNHTNSKIKHCTDNEPKWVINLSESGRPLQRKSGLIVGKQIKGIQQTKHTNACKE